MSNHLKNHLPILVFIFAVLNLLDYITTIYAFKTVLNVYEMNYELSDFELMFKVKIINGSITIFFGLIIALALEKLKDIDLFTRICYYVVFCLMTIIVAEYILVVINNIYVICTHSNLKPVNAILEYMPKYHKESDYIAMFIQKISKLLNLP